MEKREVLTQALDHRQNEIDMHQINIDNYTLFIQEIDANHSGDAGLVPFREQLQTLLNASLLEHKKEKIMATVIEKQLSELQ